jgi:dCTP deaminase
MPEADASPINPSRSGYWSPQTWKRRADEGVVTPFDSKHLTKGGGYELRMGREAFTTAAGTRIDLAGSSKDVDIPPGHFALLLTKERVKIPHDSLGFISVKFKHKAKGLINVSGFHVDPGYDGWLTFSVFNAGPRSITIARDSFCFLLWLAHFDEPVDAAYLYPSGTVDARGSTESLDDGMVDDLKGEFCSPMSLKKELEEHKARQIKWRWVGGIVIFVLTAIGTKVVDDLWDRFKESKTDSAVKTPASPGPSGDQSPKMGASGSPP